MPDSTRKNVLHRAMPITIVALFTVACSETPRVNPYAETTLGGSASARTDTVSLIDSTINPAIAGRDGWNYYQRATVDLDGDGTAESVVITAQVEMYRGRPAWDDGQSWQVYIEKPDSTRHYVYASRLQLGTLTMRVTRPDGGVNATIVLIEHLPDRLRIAEAMLDRSGMVTTVVRFERRLDPTGETAAPRLQ